MTRNEKRIINIISAVFLVGTVSISSVVIAQELTVEIEKTIDEDLSILTYATPYLIRVMPTQQLSLDDLRNSQTFAVSIKETGKSINISRVTYAGFTDERSGVTYYEFALLWGNFRPDVVYEILVRYPDGKSETAETKKMAGAKQSPALQFFKDATNFKIEPFTTDKTDDLGFKYNFEYVLRRWAAGLWGGVSTLKLSTSGEFSTSEKSDDIQSSLKGGLSYETRFHPQFKLDISGLSSNESDIRTYTYPFGFRILPAEFETNQDFSIVDYTLKGQAVMTIPYSEYPVLLWHKATGVNRVFFPLALSAGYAYVKDIEDNKMKRKENITHRFDSEIIYDFALANNIDFSGKWRIFLNLEDSNTNNLLELGITYFFDDERKTGLKLSYQDGSLPPEFENSSSIRLGFSVDLF